MSEYGPGEEFNLVFAMTRGDQLSRLQEQVGRLAVPPTTDEALDLALSEIEYTVHIIREAIWCADVSRIRAAAEDTRKSAATPDALEDII